MIDNKIIGNNIRHLRIERDISITELSIQLDVGNDHLSTVELGKQMPSVKLMVKLANFFNVDFMRLIEDDQEQTENEVTIDLGKKIHTSLLKADFADLQFFYSLATKLNVFRGDTY